MFFGLFQTIVVLSAGASALLWLVRPTRPVFGFAGAAGWSIAALQARNLTVISNGTEIAAGSEALQYVALGLALLNITTVVLWYFGVYPPVESETAGGAAVPGERARTGNRE